MNQKCAVLFVFLFWSFVSSGQDALPPILLSPADGDTLSTFWPTFSWTLSTTSVGGSSTTQYEIKIVEILSNQSPEAAIQANPDYYSQTDILVNLFAYPLSAPYFKSNHRYAWQVTMQYNAGSGEAYVPRTLQSEVFWFGSTSMNDRKCLTLLQEKKPEHIYVIENGELVFKLDTAIQEANGSFAYQITTLAGVNITTSPILPEKIDEGAYYLIPLKKFDTFRRRAKRNSFYLLTATNLQGKVYSAQFTCQ
ncbi:MAG: hypothetical protein V4714_11035 [Bacteroidota bacterium]